jgi:hypothetical protein
VSPDRFYLGTDEPSWLRRVDVPLFVSHRRLARLKRFPRARGRWALDSGGFTELSAFGEWRTSPAEYVSAVRRYAEEIGSLEWASPQDWMCEPAMLAKTGLSVEEHQIRTVDNFVELRRRAPELPFVPVLQGWTRDDYLRCADRYAAAGVDLEAEPTVGVGTVCRRQDTGHARHIMTSLARLRLRIHGFGVKIDGLRVYGESMASADSMAWSYRARAHSNERRARGGPRPPCGKRTCAHCAHFALAWRERALRSVELARPEPLALFDL